MGLNPTIIHTLGQNTFPRWDISALSMLCRSPLLPTGGRYAPVPYPFPLIYQQELEKVWSWDFHVAAQRTWRKGGERGRPGLTSLDAKGLIGNSQRFRTSASLLPPQASP